MLKRLRSAHPMLYCLGAEVLFLGMPVSYTHLTLPTICNV